MIIVINALKSTYKKGGALKVLEYDLIRNVRKNRTCSNLPDIFKL